MCEATSLLIFKTVIAEPHCTVVMCSITVHGTKIIPKWTINQCQKYKGVEEINLKNELHNNYNESY